MELCNTLKNIGFETSIILKYSKYVVPDFEQSTSNYIFSQVCLTENSSYICFK